MNRAFDGLVDPVRLEAIEEEDCFEIAFDTSDGGKIRVRLCVEAATRLALAILEQVEPEAEA